MKLVNFSLKDDQDLLDEFEEIYNKIDKFESSIENFSFGQFDGDD